MRSLAFILALTVLFMAFKPGVQHLFSSCEDKVSCCVESCTPFATLDQDQDEEQQNDCSGNSCNPFQSCGASFVLTLNVLNTELYTPQISTNRNFSYQFNVHSQFAADFWQPPQLAKA